MDAAALAGAVRFQFELCAFVDSTYTAELPSVDRQSVVQTSPDTNARCKLINTFYVSGNSQPESRMSFYTCIISRQYLSHMHYSLSALGRRYSECTLIHGDVLKASVPQTLHDPLKQSPAFLTAWIANVVE